MTLTAKCPYCGQSHPEGAPFCPNTGHRLVRNAQVEGQWGELGAELGVFVRWAISVLFDSVFLVIWVFVQWATQRIIAGLQLSGIDVWVFNSFQILFAFSTVIPIVVYVYVDIRIMLLRAQSRIQQEIKRRPTKLKRRTRSAESSEKSRD